MRPWIRFLTPGRQTSHPAPLLHGAVPGQRQPGSRSVLSLSVFGAAAEIHLQVARSTRGFHTYTQLPPVTP